MNRQVETIVDVTRAACQRTGRKLGTRVKAGQWQAVEVKYDAKGLSTVTELGPWGTVRDAASVLRGVK